MSGSFSLILLLCAYVARGLTRSNKKVHQIQQEPMRLDGRRFVYVGSFDEATVSAYELASNDKPLRFIQSLQQSGKTAEWLAVHPTLPYVYAVNNFEAQSPGEIIGYKADTLTGKLSVDKIVPSGGKGPCRIAVHSSGRFLAVANYDDGRVALLSLDDVTGAPSEPAAVDAHGLLSHDAVFDPSGNFLLVTDAGAGKLRSYRVNAGKELMLTLKSELQVSDSQKLKGDKWPWAALVKKGINQTDHDNHLTKSMNAGSSRPRHVAFHPDGRHAFLVHEATGDLDVLDFDSTTGALRLNQHFPLSQQSGVPLPAEVVVHPSTAGDNVYISDNWNGAIQRFVLEKGTKSPRWVEATQLGSSWWPWTLAAKSRPRHFTIDRAGKLMFAARQGHNSISTLAVEADGQLKYLTETSGIHSPACVVLLEHVDPPASAL